MLVYPASSRLSSAAFRVAICSLVAALATLFAGCGQPAVPVVHDPGAVSVVGALGNPLLLANGQSTVYARIRIGTLPRPERPRGPVNVAVALDTSGSMEGAAMEEARKAALQMIDALKDGDRLAVIAFHTKTEVLLPSTELDAEARIAVKKRIAEMKAEGTTDLGEGLDAAIEQVRAHFTDKAINRVVLLSDGIPNKPAGIEDSARRAAENGIAVTTLGLGLDYDETLMGKIAQLSGGRFKYIESAEKVAGFFHDELLRLDTVYGRHASAVLTAGPGVKIEAVVGQEAPTGGAAYVPLGDIARGDTRDILVRLTVTPRKAGVPIELLDTTITFDDALENGGKLERHVYLGAHTTEEEAKVVKARNIDVELSAALAEASATTLLALDVAKKGLYVKARTLLTTGSEAARAQAKRTPSPELEKHAANMVSVANDMPEVDKPIAPPKAASGGYEFSDDSLNSGGYGAAETVVSPAPVSPTVARKIKEAHSYAFDGLQ